MPPHGKQFPPLFDAIGLAAILPVVKDLKKLGRRISRTLHSKEMLYRSLP
jgi:hypothetical protein